VSSFGLSELCGHASIPLAEGHPSGLDTLTLQQLVRNHTGIRIQISARCDLGDSVPKPAIVSAGRNTPFTLHFTLRWPIMRWIDRPLRPCPCCRNHPLHAPWHPAIPLPATALG
jgi:hypothetical protein